MDGSFYNNLLVHTAVYWGSPVNAGGGAVTFADPVEIDCRWDDRQEKFVNERGEDSISESVVYTNQALALGGYLMRGTLSDLQSDDERPLAYNLARPIRALSAIDSIDGSLTVHTAFLRRG